MVALNHQLSTTLPGRNTPETCDKLPLRKEAAEHGQGVFFCCGPFARAPRHWFLENFLLSAPGVQSVFFCCAPLGAATFRRGQSKNKKTPPRVFFFFAPAPGKGRGRRSPRAGTGPEQKKHHPGWFFLLRPRRKAREGEAPLGAGTGPEQKKNTAQGVFFCSGPGKRQGKEKPRWAGPVPAPNGASPSPAFPRGRSKKKHPGWCFFFWLRPRADAHSLTAGLGGDASPSPGWCFFFFFLLRPRPDRGGVFFFAVAPPGRSLTHCGLGRFRLGPGDVFFFLLRPRRVFLDDNKKCLGYYIGSKKTRRGHSKKKTPLPAEHMREFPKIGDPTIVP